MAKIDDRVTELEIELADLRALKIEVADLRAQLASRPAPVTPVTPPKPRAVVEEGATVTHPVAMNRAFVMASRGELDQLLAIVCRRYPQLLAGIKPGRFASQDEADFRNEFELAFRGLGVLRRSAEVDEKHGVDYWIRMLGERASTGSVHALPFITAAIAHNDILFQLCPAWMMSSSFGLSAGELGTAASDKWKGVISSGMARDSLPLPRHRQWSMGMSSTIG